MDTSRQIPIESPEARRLLSDVSIVYTDLDGTLLAPGGRILATADGTPSTAAANALVALANRGIVVVPVSGRNRVQLSELCRLLGFDGFMAEMGTVTVRGTGARAEVSYDTGIWPEGTLGDRTPFEVIEQSGAVEALLREFPGELEPHEPWTDHRECTHLLRGRVDPARAAELLSVFELPLTLLDNGTIHPPKHTLTITGNIHAYHLLPTGTSKAHAIAADMSHRGVLRSQAVAVGDSAADAAMGDATGALVMMANSLENIRVIEAIERRGGPTLVTTGRATDGWVEFASVLLDALG